MQDPHPLSQTRPRAPSKIVAVNADEGLALQLEEQGFVVGETVEVEARGLFGGSPLAVRVGRAVIALRRNEAEALMVEPL